MGSEGTRKRDKRKQGAILDDFRAEDNGLAEYVLKNLYVYFWRWATWKVFDAIEDDRAGVVCFITTGGYVGGPGFKGMREYLRRTCSAGWIIDVSPEGIRPNVPTRVFAGVQQPLAIGIFVRDLNSSSNIPATIHHTKVEGRKNEKYEALAELDIESGAWRQARSAWKAPFTPAADSDWDDYPALSDLLPWVAPGVKPNRTWVYAPLPAVLAERWSKLLLEDDSAKKRELFKESNDTPLDKVGTPLPGSDTHSFSATLTNERGELPKPLRAGYRSFDRQWIIPDSRLLDRPRPDLWAARSPSQVFVVEQHAHPIAGGPGVVFSNLIPDMHFFNNRGGRTLPMLHPDRSSNLAPGFANALAEVLDKEISTSEIVAYLGGTVGHSAFTERFTDELTTPGIRVPLTTDTHLWEDAVSLGRQVIWLHTYGEAFADESDQRPHGNIRFPKGDPRQPLSLKPVTKMPTDMTYNADTETLRLGDGEWGPVKAEVFNYAVGGRNVINSWFNYRKKSPTGKKTSPLDDIHVDSWPPEWTSELSDLLTVLTRLVELEPAQAGLLDRILDGPILTMDELAARGVVWPTTKKDRAPRRAGLGGGSAQQPTLGEELAE
jgi:predicted helicase